MPSNKLEEQPWYIALSRQRSRIRELLECPVDWNQAIPRRLALPNLLHEYWAEFVLDYQVDCEGEYIDDDLFGFGIMLETESRQPVLDSQIINIESWIEQARKNYTERTRRFAELTIADRETYSKHLLSKNVTREEILRASTSGRSLFYPEILNEDLIDLAWDSMVCLCREECDEDCDGSWRRFFEVSEMKIYAESLEPVGACYGKETSIVRLIFDASTPIVHAHPITEAEAGERVISPHKFPTTWKDTFVSLYEP
jgi:hypothetical protein